MSSLAVAHQPPANLSCTPLDHDRLRDDTARWRQAGLVGYFCITGRQELFEMRNCPFCGSTLTRCCRVVAVEYVKEPETAGLRLVATDPPAKVAQGRRRVGSA